MPREQITLACTTCKRKNYTSTKNKTRTTGRIEKTKYCPFDRKHVAHREVR